MVIGALVTLLLVTDETHSILFTLQTCVIFKPVEEQVGTGPGVKSRAGVT